VVTEIGGVELVANLGSEIGEGPVWDRRIGRLVWVDIAGRLIHLTDPVSGTTDSIETPSQVGSVAIRRAGGYVAALEDGFWVHDAGEWRRIAPAEDDRPDVRFNDGKSDPAGRFWAGSMALDGRGTKGSLYRLDIDHTVTRIIEGVGISNGLAWSEDELTMFYIDTHAQRVDTLRFDAATGAASDRTPFIEFPSEDGNPDGMELDAEGGLWVALWGGWAVNRYVDGRPDRTIRLPVSNVTSCTFGGPDLETLFITSAWQELSDAQRAEQPLAGALFRVDPGVRGRPAAEYLG
jgi:sugar lactone lactonase YvrE